MPAEGGEAVSKKRWAFLGHLALSVLLNVVVTSVLFFARYGVPLWGAPSPKDVESVTVECGGANAVFTDQEKIELAVKLINYLNYQPFTPVSENSLEVGPDVSITYRLKDGGELSAAANWVTGWWNGKAHALKEPDAFVNLAKGIFYMDS